MAYLVTARKWRPRRFDEIVGQEHITTTLKNALSSGRIASCYLFCGPRGVGKTTTARILAKGLNCAARQGSDPCGECASCRSITEGTSLDVLEIDGASNNSVDDVRELREVVRYVPAEGKYKIYIIDEVHMLSTPAFNALLKTLEEPPPHVVFVFATTEVQEVPDTILSRCQRFNFRRLPASQIAGHLEKIAQAEGLKADAEALFLLARRADGSLRDAESLLDQVVAFAPEQVTTASAGQVLGLVDRTLYFELLAALGQADPRAVLDLVAGVVDEGGDLEEFVHGFAEHVRHLLLARVQGREASAEIAQAERERYEEAAAAFAVEDLVRMLQALLDLGVQLRHSLQPRFRAELALVRLALMGRAVDLGHLIGQVDRLAQALEAGGRPVRGGRGPAAPPLSADRAEAPRPAAAAEVGDRPPGEAAQVAPAQPAPAPAAELDLAQVRQEWDSLVQEVRRTQPPLGIFLQGASLVGLEGKVLKLGFAAADRFHKEQVDKNRKVVEDLCLQRWGQSLRVVCVVQDKAETRPRQPEGARHADPTIKSVLDAFDGELL